MSRWEGEGWRRIKLSAREEGRARIFEGRSKKNLKGHNRSGQAEELPFGRFKRWGSLKWRGVKRVWVRRGGREKGWQRSDTDYCAVGKESEESKDNYLPLNRQLN